MSGMIDINTVKMVFDNVLFQKNAEETLSTLDKLKEALNFEGAVKGLENLGNNVKNAGMDGLYNGVYKVQEGFSALDVVATRVLQNITDKVQGLITNLASEALTKPLKQGFEEYELQMDSVQTITASTGESVATVNGYLDELNEYADKTIYSFSDMTANIGKFTNAGVSLDKAVAAIQGVSNVAAISGANTNEASRAMYNFAQALSAGSVKLIDWKSIENANMATVGFKQSLIDTAVAMGTLVKEGDNYVSTTTDANGKVSDAFNATQMFNDSLSHQWMTTDVLVQTLQQYSTNVDELSQTERDEYENKLRSIGYTEEQIEAIEELGRKAAAAAKDVKTFSQLIDTIKESLGSGWTKSWQLIFGDLNEAKKLWTDVNNVISGFIDRVSTSRNNILETWRKSGYTYNEYGELVKAVYDENGKLDADLSTELVENGEMIRSEMGGRMMVIEGLRNVIQGIGSVLTEFSSVFKTDFLGIGNDALSDISITGEKLKNLSGTFYDFSEKFKNSLTMRNESGEAVGFLKELRTEFEAFARALRTGYDGVASVFSGLKNIFSSLMSSKLFSIETLNALIGNFGSITSRINDFGNAFNKHFGKDAAGNNQKGLIKFFDSLVEFGDSFILTKLEFMVTIFDSLGKIIEHLIEPFGTFSDLLGSAGGVISRFSEAFRSLIFVEDTSRFETFFDSIATSFNSFIDSIRKSVDFSGISKFFDNLINAITDDKVGVFKTFENVFGGLVDILKAFIAVAAPVGAAFANVFGGAIEEALTFIRELSERFKGFTESLVANESVISGIQHLFEGLFKVIKAIAEVVGTIFLSAWDSLGRIFGEILPSSENLSTTLFNLGDRLSEFADGISSLVTGGEGIPKLSELIGGMTDKFIGLFTTLSDVSLLEKFKNLIEHLGDGIKRALGGNEDMSLLDVIFEKIKNFMDRLKDLFSDANGNLDFVKIFEAGGIAAVIKKLIDFFTSLKENMGNFTGFLSVFNDIKDAIDDLSSSLQDKFKAESIKAIATAILEIAGALFIVAMIDPIALTQAVVTIKLMFDMIEALLMTLKGFNKEDAAVLAATAAALQTLGNAVLLMSGAIVILGTMDILKLAQGLGALGVMLQGMVWVIKEFASIEGSIPKVAGALMGLAIAIDMLIIPVKVFGGMDFESLVKGLGALAVVMVLLVSALESIDRSIDGGKTLIAASAAMILMATSISILASAVKKIAGLEWEGVAKGLIVLAAGLGAMVGAAAIIDKQNLSDEMMSMGTSLLMLGAAMVMLSMAVKGIAGVSWEDLGKSAAVLAGALVALGAASHFIDGKNLLMIGGAIALVATAFLELSGALELGKIIGPLCTTIGNGIQGVADSAIAFAQHAAGQAFIQFLKDAILFLPQLAVALAKTLVDMVATLGNAAAELVGAAVKIGSEVLQGLMTLLPQLFEVIRVFIQGVIELIIAEGPGIFEALTVLGTEFWTFLTSQVPLFFEFLTSVFTELFTFLQTEGPLLIETIRLGIDTILQAIIEEAPVIGETLLTLLHTILDVINTAIPEITGTLLSLLTELLAQLAEFAPQMAEHAMTILVAFLTTVAEHIGEITESAISIALAFMRGIGEKMPEIVDTAFKLIIDFINGLAEAIEKNHNALFEAIGNLIKAIVDALIDGITLVGNAAGELILGEGGVLDSLGGFFKDMVDAGLNLVQGFIEGLLSAPKQLWDAACSLANDAWNAITSTLDEHSPSRLTYGGGKNFTLGFINGISDFAGKAASESSLMAQGVLNAFNRTIDANKGAYVPMITPVFDGSNVTRGLSAISAMDTGLSNTFTTDLTASVDGSISGLNSSIDSLNDKISAITSRQDELYDRMDYWLAGIRSDTGEIQDLTRKGGSIYMDSGALVGAIAPSMDSALGMRQVMAGRGVL